MGHSEYEIELVPGSSLLLYTDGVTEAENEDHVQFGTDGLLKTINCHDEADEDPDSVLDCVYGSLKDFAQGAPQFDDITVMYIRYLGKNE